MDEKIEDKSEQSRIKHIAYYKSLTKIIKDIKTETEMETDETIRKHLRDRINALNLDKERIRKMFPDSLEEFKDEEAE